MLNTPEIVENKTDIENIEHTIDTNVENIEITDNNITKNTEVTKSIEEQDSPEISEATSSEPINIDVEEANTTNCLALTIKKDHKLVAVKNVVLKSIRMSWKVIISTITLGIIKFFT